MVPPLGLCLHYTSSFKKNLYFPLFLTQITGGKPQYVVYTKSTKSYITRVLPFLFFKKSTSCVYKIFFEFSKKIEDILSRSILSPHPLKSTQKILEIFVREKRRLNRLFSNSLLSLSTRPLFSLVQGLEVPFCS